MTSYVVVGAGLAGSATAWQLARRGEDVVLVERTEPANEHGSSHGSARIFRYGYPDPFYTGLVVRAREAWDELEALAGQQLVAPSGSLDHGAERRPVELAARLAAAGVEHELLDPAAAAARWPGMVFDSPVLWHPGAGVIDAETSVLAMARLAQEAGATVLTGWPVARVVRDGAGFRVVAETGAELRADRVVVSAGGWLPDLLATLPASLARRVPPLQVRQEQAFHFPYRDAARPWPTFIHKTPGIQVYGLPGGRDADFRGQKVAEYNGGRVVGSAAAADGVVDPVNRERVVAYVEQHLPGLVPEPYAETTCLFTNTPDEDFVVDGADGITVVSPCSGHGAKFAPLIGRVAADVATGAAEAPPAFRLAAVGA
ncbi:FAD-dependent oxidoreductase [Nocardioides sp. ChNu-99]|uniref:FAD-dependent oxidoreductase n=1 Tax=Nocardioides sp. ChNu-99 TaxID=2839897 RepID=UPI00240669D1|nr:FAD-dependent oxidoreductase [Nocardioides sp. ChNu-99]MDF9717613.1 FAD-dependent oxidoreductase [Nocardioides sp. ChNu-99]